MLSRFPEAVAFTPVVGIAGQNKQQVGQPIQVDENLGVDGDLLLEGCNGSFGSATDSTGQVEPG
jgi:hypothetical protein